MSFSLFDYELAEATGSAAVRASALRHHAQVMQKFLRPSRGLVLEWLRPDGSEFGGPVGTAVLPGHAIESLWFQMHIARGERDAATQDRAVEAIRRHLEIGWDSEYGGLFLAVDADGRAEVAWPFADYKLWWPQTEALYATLLAYEYSRQDWCIEWHERIREFCHRVYPVPNHGEWYQKLNRECRPVEDLVALPVKDPFHLPRALILCLEALDRMLGD
jgi:N-acylglucosamine 2-epimerase